jgi:hypothetical protein
MELNVTTPQVKFKVQTVTSDAAVLEHCRIEESCCVSKSCTKFDFRDVWKSQWLSTSRRAGGNDCVENLDTCKCVSKKSIRV